MYLEKPKISYNLKWMEYQTEENSKTTPHQKHCYTGSYDISYLWLKKKQIHAGMQELHAMEITQDRTEYMLRKHDRYLFFC